MWILIENGYVGKLFLGFDTGTSNRGENNLAYALLETNGDVYESGVWRLQKKALCARFSEISTLSKGLIYTHRYNIIACGIEEPWIDPKNRQVGLKLAKVWGILAAQAWGYTIPVVGIYPTTAKKALTGNAKATKSAVLKAAQMLKPGIKQYDESDAIAIAAATRDAIIERAMKGIGYDELV